MTQPTQPATLITGASQGLGRALALALARPGARLALVARRADALQAVVTQARAQGADAWPIVADVGDPSAAARIVGQATDAIGPIDRLIHNASTLGPLPLRPLLDLRDADLQRVLDVNLLGPYRISRRVVGSMALRGKGLVVHISSDAAVEAHADWGAYSLSKAALDHLGRLWSAELADRGVRFVSVDPGEMDTAMHADALPDADRTRLRRPEDVAQALLLAVESAPGGARLTLDGAAGGAR